MKDFLLNFINSGNENFNFRDCIIGGDDCVLIIPKNITCKWEKDTLMFRSIIIRKCDGLVVSRGFNRFFNWGEQPDLDKFPDGPFEVREKKDGSLLILGYHNYELIARTRGTANLDSMENGDELEFLKTKYPKLILGVKFNPDYSILCEWQTRTNIIVINEVEEPTLTLVGVINNETGVLLQQKILDSLAEAWEVPRPIKYHYNTIAECLQDVKMWVGKEGIVSYSEDGQKLRKGKGDWYCEVHKLATGMRGIGNVIDLFMVSPKFTKYSEFYAYVETSVDFEVAEKIKDDILKVVTSYCKVLENINTIKCVVDQVRGDSFSRKDQALTIIQNYPLGFKKSMAFLILDNREIPDTLLRTAIEETIEKL